MKKLKLNRLSDQSLAEKQMNSLMGGSGINCGCYCGCCYENQGGSTTQDNGRANQAGGLYSDCGIPTLHF